MVVVDLVSFFLLLLDGRFSSLLVVVDFVACLHFELLLVDVVGVVVMGVWMVVVTGFVFVVVVLVGGLVEAGVVAGVGFLLEVGPDLVSADLQLVFGAVLVQEEGLDSVEGTGRAKFRRCIFLDHVAGHRGLHLCGLRGVFGRGGDALSWAAMRHFGIVVHFLGGCIGGAGWER
jgi:hypothetical protein